MKFYIRVAIFLIINFGALGIGSILMDNGPQSSWYTNLNQAPWTPPGWVFGFAWTTIMFCFSIYMAKLLEVGARRHKGVSGGDLQARREDLHHDRLLDRIIDAHISCVLLGADQAP